MDTLEGMRVFARVVEAGNFTRAAAQLGLSKALVSKYVGQLENKLGASLLQRTTRRVRPTEIGSAYYERCLKILDDVDDLQTSVHHQQANPRGRLRIAGPRFFGEDPLVDCVQAFLQHYPHISVDLVLEERTVDIVAEGFDIAVRIGGLAESTLIARKIMHYPYAFCAAPSYLARAGTPHSPADLKHHACLVNSIISPTNQWRFIVDGMQTTITVEPRIRINSARSVSALVKAGQGIGLCLLSGVVADIEAGRIVRVLEAFDAYDRHIYAVYPRDRHLTAKVRLFIDHMVETFAQRT
jgi:DNA-binding transcriptional LysR family regulator